MTDNEYKIYDATIAFLMGDITNRAKDANEISLMRFEPKSHEHMTVLYAAMYAASLTGKIVDVNLGWFDYLKFRIKNRGMKAWYKNKTKKKNTIANIDVPNIIGEVYEKVTGAEIFTTGIGCIYDEYYAPKKEER